jgi:hypothetical protein
MKNGKMFSGFWRLIICLGWGTLAMPVTAERLATLPQVMRPNYLAFTDQRIYVVEDSSQIHIFRRGPEGVVLERTFGKQGEGPGEFDFIHQIRPLKDHLEIPTYGKFARFALDGKLLDETKLPIRVFKNAIFRVGENYVARDFQFDDKETTTTIRLYDKGMKLLRELGVHKVPGGISKINLAAEYYFARVVDEKIFLVESRKETLVTVFDANGAKLREIRLRLPPMEMTTALKEAIIKPLKEEPDMKSRWAAFESRLVFPDHTPGLDYSDIVDGKLVTRTYNYRAAEVEFVIFDLQGKELKRQFLPFTGRLNNGCLFSFFQGCFYYLKENLDAETWELHAQKVW